MTSSRPLGVPSRGSSLQALASVAHLGHEMDSAVFRLVAQARQEHRSWADIGEALGISRQAAHARYGHLVEGDDAQAPQ